MAIYAADGLGRTRSECGSDRSRDRELAGIECLRFCCALAILFWHYKHFFNIGQIDHDILWQLQQGFPLYVVFWPAYKYGYLAVQVFWVISGFIFYWHYSGPIHRKEISFFEFSLRRFARLYPLHFATLILVAVGQIAYSASHASAFIFQSNDAKHFLLHLLFATNFTAYVPFTFNAPIWSVSLEILTYLTFFGIVRYFGPHILVAALCAGACWFVFGYNYNFQTYLQFGYYSNFYPNPYVVVCGLYFFAGGVAQRISLWSAGRPAALLALLVSALLVLGLIHVSKVAYLNDVRNLLISMLLVVLLAQTQIAPMRHLAFLGNATYSSYLIHFPIQLAIVLVVDQLGIDRSIFSWPVTLLAFFIIVIGASLFVYHWYEMPAQLAVRRSLSYAAKNSQ